MGTYVITGAGSGIGRTTAELLRGRGHVVIGVDLRGADVLADLATAEGRSAMVEAVTERSGGALDAIVACAGLATPTVATVKVNYYGAVGTLVGLRPLLAGSPAPRAVAVASMASLFPPDDELLHLLLDGEEEEAALARASVLAADPQTGGLVYGTSKRALALWIRRHAAGPEWAGAGIPLNGVARPIVVAHLLAWLTSEENTHLCGQVVFVDGGSDVVIRGDSTW